MGCKRGSHLSSSYCELKPGQRTRQGVLRDGCESVRFAAGDKMLQPGQGQHAELDEILSQCRLHEMRSCQIPKEGRKDGGRHATARFSGRVRALVTAITTTFLCRLGHCIIHRPVSAWSICHAQQITDHTCAMHSRLHISTAVLTLASINDVHTGSGRVTCTRQVTARPRWPSESGRRHRR